MRTFVYVLIPIYKLYTNDGDADDKLDFGRRGSFRFTETEFHCNSDFDVCIMYLYMNINVEHESDDARCRFRFDMRMNVVEVYNAPPICQHMDWMYIEPLLV